MIRIFFSFATGMLKKKNNNMVSEMNEGGGGVRLEIL